MWQRLLAILHFSSQQTWEDRPPDRQKVRQMSDADLLAVFIDSHENVYWDELQSRMTDKVYRILLACLNYNSEAAKDAAQDVFIKIYLFLQKQSSCHIKRFRSYLATSAKNYCKDTFRKDRTEAKHLGTRVYAPENHLKEVQSSEIDENFRLEDIEGHLAFKKKLDRLDTKYKVPIALFYFDGFTITVDTISSLAKKNFPKSVLERLEKIKEELPGEAIFLSFIITATDNELTLDQYIGVLQNAGFRPRKTLGELALILKLSESQTRTRLAYGKKLLGDMY